MKDIIPFDLEKAIAGEPVVTRDGREVTELHLFKTSTNDCQKVGALVDGMIVGYTESGNYYRDIEDGRDLFMKPKPVETYWRIYDDNTVGCFIYKSLEDAQKKAPSGAASICKLSILNGEVIGAETVHRY